MIIEYQCPFPGCRAITEGEKDESVFCDRHPPAQVVMRPMFVVTGSMYNPKTVKQVSSRSYSERFPLPER